MGSGALGCPAETLSSERILTRNEQKDTKSSSKVIKAGALSKQAIGPEGKHLFRRHVSKCCNCTNNSNSINSNTGKLCNCTKKTNHFNQKCCTVPKKPKKQMFLDHWPRTSLAQTSSPDHEIKKHMLFWYSTSLLIKKTVFFGTVQQK